MKALLLAAGLGTRLRPLTDTTPKCLVTICGRPLLEIWLETLHNAGVREFLINTHYLSEQVEKFIFKSQYKDKITLVHEEELLGTGGTVLKNKDFFDRDEPFLVIHADNLSVCDYKDFISAHYLKEINTQMTMMTFRTDVPKECGVVTCDVNGIVQEFYEKVNHPPSNLANGAVYIFEYSIFTLLENLKKPEIDISTEVLPYLMGKIGTYLNDNIHIDIGTKLKYEQANKVYKKYIKNSKVDYLYNYFNSGNMSSFGTKIQEIKTRIKDQKKIEYRKKRVLAIYDCIDLPLSNDIGAFILGAEIKRRENKFEKIDLLFVIHAQDPSPLRHSYVTQDNKSQFIYNMVLEQSRVFQNIGTLFVFDNRKQFLDFYRTQKKYYNIFPEDYNPVLPVESIRKRRAVHEWANIVPSLYKDSSLLCLTPPIDQVKLVEKWIMKYIYPKIPITVTLREWDDWADERNSNIAQWQKFIDANLVNENFVFIVIRDYYKLYDEVDSLTGSNVLYCNEAVISNSFRAALYQSATLNLFVSNGSAMYAVYNLNVNYLFFSVYSKGRGATREALRDSLKLYYGESFQGSSKYQKTVWKRDTYEVLKDETEQMLKLIEADLGLEPKFYTENFTKLKVTDNVSKKIDKFVDIKSDVDRRINIKYYVYAYYIQMLKNKLADLAIPMMKDLHMKYAVLKLKYRKKLKFHSNKKTGIINLDDIINHIVSRKKTVVIYGAGVIGEILYPLLKDNIICYVDSNEKIVGVKSDFSDLVINGLDIFLNRDFEYDYIIITPKGREEAIAGDLTEKYGVDDEKILFSGF